MTTLATVGLWLALAPTAAAPAESAPTAPPASTPPPSTAPSKTAAGKLAPTTSKEMADAIIAVNKALGLESWPQHGAKPCVDRGGQGILAKDVTPEDARKCATAAVEKGFPELGKTYALAILFGAIGPVTVVALGTGDAAGWGAYSCDPTRACKAMKINPGNKWGKRLDERRAKACAEATTLWVPTRACQANDEAK
jgi:hypothetical protein